MANDDKKYEEILRERSQNWLKAAHRCDRSNNKENIVSAAKEIEEFLESEPGQVALHKLLRATNKHVLFAKNNRLHPDFPEEVYILTNAGPMRVEMGLDSEEGFMVPKATPISLEVLVRATIEYANMMPNMMLLFLLEELDKISESVLNVRKIS